MLRILLVLIVSAFGLTLDEVDPVSDVDPISADQDPDMRINMKGDYRLRKIAMREQRRADREAKREERRNTKVT